MPFGVYCASSRSAAYRSGLPRLLALARGDAVSQIGNAVEHENPHLEEMPLQSVLRPPADDYGIGKIQKADNRVVIVDSPATADHDENGDRVDPMPMHDAQ